jgi:hypothetical protein
MTAAKRAPIPANSTGFAAGSLGLVVDVLTGLLDFLDMSNN